MKTKHNKKRNTAFVYEALLREVTKSIVSRDTERKNKAISILKEYFKQGTNLSKELGCYKALIKEDALDKYTAEKVIFLASKQHSDLDKKEIFNEQSRLIKQVNTDLGTSTFSNFVPNYKSYATVYQLFNKSTPLKTRVLLEQEILETLSGKNNEQNEDMKPVDTLVVKTFVNNFNDKYSNLLPEQRDLLNKYILSLGDNVADFQLFLVKELQRIKDSVTSSLLSEDIKNDEQMTANTRLVIEQIESFNVSRFNEKDLKKVLKLQNLVNEYKPDVNKD
tara:strand:+ start:1675 stop:2508 length:834 start_codon:yes stop_codon:yes gene_type:complete